MKDPNRAQYEQIAAGIYSSLNAGERLADIEERLLLALGTTRHQRHLVSWNCDWCLAGLPHVMVDTRLAASFMATDIPADFASEIPLPWKAFLVTVPAGLLQDGELSIAVWNGTNGFVRVLFQDRRNETMWNSCESWEAFSGDDIPADSANPMARRALQLAMRLVLGACAELATRPPHTLSRASGAASQGSRETVVPSVWVTRLTRPVTSDVRKYVADYLAGARGSINTQHMRRGHWRNQPCGPRNSQRKYIHVEPTWVGPSAAPIAVRPHKLRGAS